MHYDDITDLADSFSKEEAHRLIYALAAAHDWRILLFGKGDAATCYLESYDKVPSKKQVAAFWKSGHMAGFEEAVDSEALWYIKSAWIQFRHAQQIDKTNKKGNK